MYGFYVYMSIMLFMVLYNQNNVSQFSVLGLQIQKFQDLKQPSSFSGITKGYNQTTRYHRLTIKTFFNERMLTATRRKLPVRG